MKKIFITTLLFFITLSILASSIQRDLQRLLKDQTFNLAYGIELPKDPQPFNEFKYTDIPAVGAYQRYISSAPDGYMAPYKAWYEQDFASDPFDGRIEVLVVGEPLPSTTITFLISIALAGLLLYKNKFRVVV